MTHYELRGGGTDNPMLWVYSGTPSHPMGFHLTQQLWDAVKDQGLRDVFYHRASMQSLLNRMTEALPVLPHPDDGVVRAGDLVRVGTGKVPWRVQDVTRFGMAMLSSTKTAISRSELVTNLKVIPTPAASPATTTTVTSTAAAAVGKASRALPLGVVAGVAGAAVIAGGAVLAGRHLLHRHRTTTERVLLEQAPVEVTDEPARR